MLLYIIVAIACVSALIGTIVFLKNTKAQANRWFFIHALTVSCWITTNYFSNSNSLNSTLSLWLNHAVLLFGGTVAITLNYLLESITPRRKSNKRQIILFNLLSVCILLSLTPLVVLGVTPNDTLVAIEFGPLAILYFLALIYFIVRAFWIVGRSIRVARGMHKARMQIIGIGVYGTFTVLLLTNIILPFFLSAFQASVLAPIVFVLMLSVLSYTIIKQRFFAISSSIVQTLGYFVTLSVFIGIFVLLSTYVNAAVHDSFTSTQGNLLFAIILFMALVVYHPLLTVVARLLQKIFNKDRYDTREALEKISDTLITHISSEDILKHSIQTLNKYLKPKQISYVGSLSESPIVIGSQTKTSHIESSDLQWMKSLMYIAKDVNETMTDEMLHEKSIEIVTKLSSGDEVFGYIVVSTKQTGSAYTQQDTTLLGLATKNMSLALINAKHYQEVLSFSSVLKTEIKKATEELRALSTTKDEFLSMATHQIRPQLTAVRGFIEMVEATKVTKEQKQALSWINTGVERTLRIVTDMLNLSRFSTGTFQLNKKKIDFVQVVKSEVQSLRPLLVTAGVEVKTKLPNTKVTTEADEIKIREVIANLCHNAIQYSQRDSEIMIRVEAVRDNVSFEVEDRGIGIKKSEEDKLFNKFYRTSEALDKRPTGTGIGLFLAKKVIDAHAGKIYYRKPENKQGSIFGFEIPAINK